MVRFGSALAVAALFVFSSSSALAQAQNVRAPKTVAQKKGPKKKKPAVPAAATPEVAPTSVAPSAPASDPEPPPTSPSPSPSAAKDAPPPVAPSGDEPAKPISVAPLLGYATTHLNVGLGLRAGYTLPQRIYVGGTLVYHLGSSEEIPSVAGKTEVSAHVLYPGVEVGYDLPVGPVVVRPYGGVGVAFVTASMKAEGEEQSNTKTSLALWPGCAVTYAIPRTPAFVGADARVLVITRADDPSFGMFATGGVRF
jgi:hypothetical protein